MESLFLACVENAHEGPQKTKLAQMLTNITQRKDFILSHTR